MVKYTVRLTKQAMKDLQFVLRSPHKEKVKSLLQLLESDPYATPPRYEKLVGDLSGAYSRRINIHHRLVYDVDDQTQTVIVHRMWTHYE